MPTFEFTSPDGKTYSVDGPEGSTKEQAFGILQKQLGQSTPATSAAPATSAVPAQDLTKPYVGYPSMPSRERVTPTDPSSRVDIFKRDIYDPSRMRMPTVGGATEAVTKGAGAGSVVGGAVGGVMGGLAGGQIPLGTATGAIGGGLMGGTSALVEYGLESAGFSPQFAALVSLASPTKYAETIAERTAPKVVNAADRLLSNIPGVRGLYEMGKGLIDVKEQTGAAKRVSDALAGLTGGAAPSREAEVTVGQSMGRGAREAQMASQTRVAETQAQIEQRATKEMQQEKERVARLSGRATGAELMQQQSNAQKAAQASNLTVTAPSELGGEIQGRLVGRQGAIDTEMKQAYEAQLTDFLDFARAEQRAGRFWQDSEAGKGAITKLQSLTKPTEEMGPVKRMTSEEESAVNKVLDEIQGTRKVTVSDPYPETKIVKEPVDVMVIDNVIRKLGEAAKGRPAEGYEAIGKNLALEMRGILRNAMGNYSESYGAAKKSYSDALKLLETYQEGPVAKVAETSAKVRDRLTNDPQGVADSLFRSPSAVSDLTEALGDKKTVVDLGRQYINNKLASFEGKVKDTENWLKNSKTQETIDALGLKGYGDDYLNNLKKFDVESRQFGKRAKALEAQVTPEKIKAGRKAVVSEEQAALNKVRTQASDYEKRVADAANLGKFEEARLETLLNSGTPSSVRRVGQMLDDAGRQAMPDAIRQYLSRSQGSKLPDNWNKLKPMLEYGKLMNPSQIAKLDADVSRAISEMGKTPTRKQINQLGILISSRVAGSLAGMTVTPE